MNSNGKFDVQRNNGLVAIAGAGEFSLYIAPELDKALKDAVASGDDVTVDLTSALYIDSVILMALVAAGRKLPSGGRKLKVLVSDHSHPHYVLKITGAHTFFDVTVVGA